MLINASALSFPCSASHLSLRALGLKSLICNGFCSICHEPRLVNAYETSSVLTKLPIQSLIKLKMVFIFWRPYTAHLNLDSTMMIAEWAGTLQQGLVGKEAEVSQGTDARFLTIPDPSAIQWKLHETLFTIRHCTKQLERRHWNE